MYHSITRLLSLNASFWAEKKDLEQENQAKKKAKDNLSLSDCINLTGAKSVTRTTHDGLSAENKSAASDAINKTLKTKINKEVKNTLVDIAYREKLNLLNCGILE